MKIVIVEDSAVSAAVIERVLEQKAGWQVVGIVPDAEAALALCADMRPDVLTLDLHSPRGDGLEQLSDIRTRCTVPIVVVSASTYEGSPVTAEALIRGADAVFDKARVLADPQGFRAVLEEAATVIG